TRRRATGTPILLLSDQRPRRRTEPHHRPLRVLARRRRIVDDGFDLLHHRPIRGDGRATPRPAV
ncbi:hypothetical protein LTR28_000464, partial [Elasticomyces elasticus]